MHGPQSVCPCMIACVHLPIERKLLFPWWAPHPSPSPGFSIRDPLRSPLSGQQLSSLRNGEAQRGRGPAWGHTASQSWDCAPGRGYHLRDHTDTLGASFLLSNHTLMP